MSASDRFGATPVSDPGVTESQWQQWFSTQTWPLLEVQVERLIVLAAHPDDEVLGAAGMMLAAIAAGIDVVPVCLSDGSGSHPGSATLSPEGLAAVRRRELDAATDVLGLGASRWGGLPDGSLAVQGAAMTRFVESVCDEEPEAITGLLSVWEHDGHPDHEAVGRCAADIAARRGLQVWRYPIWMWHWAIPGDPEIPWDTVHRHRLDDAALAAKRAAVATFETQIHPLSDDPADQVVLPEHVLERLLRADEFVFG